MCEASDNYSFEALWEYFELTITLYVPLYQVGKVRKGTATLVVLLDTASERMPTPQWVFLFATPPIGEARHNLHLRNNYL